MGASSKKAIAKKKLKSLTRKGMREIIDKYVLIPEDANDEPGGKIPWCALPPINQRWQMHEDDERPGKIVPSLHNTA